MNGFLILNKPVGPTSHDMVAMVRRLVGRKQKVGHTGTLDPGAGGVLPIAVGRATRLADELRDADKAYCGVIELGTVTDTDDAAGTVVAQAAVPAINADQLAAVIAQFRGPISQLPPAYSAIHVAGQRAYELARRGLLPDLPLRDVVIHALDAELLSATQIAVTVSCSKGTYIRALARDIGAALGCGGHLSSLLRTRVGLFSLEQAVDPQDLRSADDVAQRLLPMGSVLGGRYAHRLSDDDYSRVVRGMPIAAATAADLVAAYRSDGELTALMERIDDRWHPRKVFVQDTP
jgi:tRNA pseudouridine55 synthase